MQQSTNHIFLVRPANFGFNDETATSNAFQNKLSLSPEEIKTKVLAEFDAYVNKLRKNNIDVLVIDDTETPVKPDAIFPNNWGSFHANGLVILYPMEAPNRRVEKRTDVIDFFQQNYQVNNIVDLSHYEKDGLFCEGTGSIIFDHIHKIAYACLSPRTNKDVFVEVCELLGYKPLYFTSVDKNHQEIYHTNVMMCVSQHFSVICLDSIADEDEKEKVIRSLEETGHEIIDISFEQMNHFAGNMLSVLNADDEEFLVMSESAFAVLSTEQKEAIESYCTILPVNIKTIETIGGGSARCMISEMFMAKK